MLLNHLDKLWGRLTVTLGIFTADFEMDESPNFGFFSVSPIALNLAHSIHDAR